MRLIGLIAISILLSLSLHSQNESLTPYSLDKLIDSLKAMPYSEKAHSFAVQINQLAKQRNDTFNIATIKMWLGKSHSNNREYEKAIRHQQDAMSIGNSLNNTTIKAAANLNLSMIYLRLKEYEKALLFSKESIQLYKNLEASLCEARALANLGIIYLETGQLNKALEYFLLARPILIKKGTKKDINSLNSNIAIIYVQKGKPKQALPYFEASLLNDKLNQDTFKFAASYGNLAYNYQNLGNFNKAFIYYDSSLYYSNLLQQDEITYITLLDMSDGYKLKGDYRNALEYYQKYHDLNKKIINKKVKKNITELEIKFDTQKKELALKESQKEVLTLEQEAQIQRQRMALFLGGLVTSFILALFIFYKWKNDIKNKEIKEQLIQSELKNKQLEAAFLQNQLENKKGDLTNLALDIGRKNKFSNKLIEKLEALEKEKPKKMKAQLREIIQYAISNLQINEDLDILQKNVDQINQAFYQKMETRFGKLSANEKYLAGLLRLNLSNKDIATLRGISVSSAKMSRYRLRKKLNLDADEDIQAFLQRL